MAAKLALLLLIPVLVSCSNASVDNSTEQEQQAGKAAGNADAPVHSIVLPHDQPEFPAGPGRELFISRCTVCHSLRYVTMQPNFPGKVWTKEVDKMIKSYRAHISPEEAKQIADYLTTIKGVPDKH